MDGSTRGPGLDERAVAEIVAAQFPDLAGRRVTYLGHGMDHVLFSVGGSVVFRFARRPERVAWLRREVDVLARVPRALEALTPRVGWLGQPTPAYPFPFFGYTLLLGEPASGTPAPRLAEDLAAFLSALHRADPTGLEPTPDGWEDEPWSDLADEVAQGAGLVVALLDGDLALAAAPYLRGEVAPPPRGGVARLVHNDLCAEHVLVDPADGRLTGVLDFSDAMVGDPVLDLVGLLTIGDRGFVDAVVARYGLDLGEGAVRRLEWLSRVSTLRWLAEAVRAGDHDVAQRHLVWVERAFEPRR